MVNPAVPAAGTAAVGAGVAAALYAGIFRPFASSGSDTNDRKGNSGPDLSPIAGIEDVVNSDPVEGGVCDWMCYDEYLPYIIGLLIVLVVAVIGWIFYPAYVARKGGDMPDITEETLSPPTPKSSGNKLSASSPNKAEASPDTVPMLTIVIPAYNEQYRLPKMLELTLTYLRESRKELTRQCLDTLGEWYSEHELKNLSHSVEIVVVSDGSTDDTESIVRSYADDVVRANPANTLRLVRLSRNSGKGAAVRAGMARSKGMLCLMVDADGATEFGSGLAKVLAEMKGVFVRNRTSTIPQTSDASNAKPICAVFGSRAHMEDDSTASRSIVRTFLMHAFHFFVKCLCSSNIRDTQCGFKIFTREAASILSYNLHLRRWAFDTELVVMMERKGWPIAEVAVNWHEVDGSKIDESKLALALNSLGMLRDMICVRACYALRLWRLSMPEDDDSSR